MTANNSESMLGMFFYPIRIDMLLCSIKLLFCNYLLSLLIVDQLFFDSINTLDFTNNLASNYAPYYCLYDLP